MGNQLTHEKISKRFTSLFELVNYSIKIAENLILTGRTPRVRNKSLNPALLAIDEVEEGKEIIQAIEVERAEEVKTFDTRKKTSIFIEEEEDEDEDEDEEEEETVHETAVE